MSASPPPPRRRRPRRGSAARPVNGSLYRGALAAPALALLLLAFTISSPSPLAKPALPETFDTAAAVTLSRQLETNFPDRAPGSLEAGDGTPLAGATAWFIDALRGYGLHVETSTWRARLPGRGSVELTNVVAVAAAPDQSQDAIVVVANRDDLGVGPGANDNASGTGVLLELARSYAVPSGSAGSRSVASFHPIVFLSTDGDSYGNLGTVHFIQTTHFRDRIAAVIDLDALAGSGRVSLEIAGLRSRSPSVELVATAEACISEATGQPPAHVGLLGQLVDLAFPFSLYGQGPFIAAGIPAVTITTAGDRPPPQIGDTRLDAARIGELGQAAQTLLASLDQDIELAPRTPAMLFVGSRTVHGWAVELVLIALLLPPAAIIVDLYAFCRRQRIALAPAMHSIRRRAGFWLFVGAVFTCFRVLGAWPDAAAHPPNPGEPAATRWPLAGLSLLVLIVAAGWAVARQRLVVRRRVLPAEVLAGYLVALVGLLLIALVIAATNPFALLFVLPALNTWIWLPQVRIAHAPVRLAVFAVGLLGPAIIVISFATRFQLGLAALSYLLTLVADGYITTLAVVLALAFAAVACQLAAITAGRYAPYPSAGENGSRGPLRALGRRGALALERRRRALASRSNPPAEARYSAR